MRRVSLFLALLAAPHFTLAQPVKAPVSPHSTTKLPEAQELLDHLVDPYEAAKSYRGRVEITLGADGTRPRTSFDIQTAYRYNEAGDKEREKTSLTFQNSKSPARESGTFEFWDDGQSGTTVALGQKVWAPSTRNGAPLLRSIMQTLLAEIVSGLNDSPFISPVVSRGKDGGRAVYIVRGGPNDDLNFRLVVDAQTRALRSLNLGPISIRASNQFDVPLSDSEFQWTPPAGFKRVSENEIAIPTFLREAMEKHKQAEAEQPATAPKN